MIKMNKAQVTVETLIVVGAVLLIFVTVSLPISLSSSRSSKDVQHFSDARFALDTISTAANTISSKYDTRKIEVYIPGFTSSGSTSGGYPLVQRKTRIYLDTGGDRIYAEISVIKRKKSGAVTYNKTATINMDLAGDGWVLGNSSGNNEIIETGGGFYAFNITWKNITFIKK